MVKIVFLLVLCLFTMSSSRAQIKDIEFMLGPSMGTLHSNMTDPGSLTTANYSAKMGYSAGVGSSYYFTENFSLGAQLIYQKTTVRGNFPFEFENFTGNLELTTSFDHLSLPVRARYTMGNKVKFSSELGGFINCLLNSTAKDYFMYGSITPTFAEASEQYTRFDAGLSLGFSSQVSLSEKLNVKLSLTDNYGLVNISALQYPQFPIHSSNFFKSNTMNLLAGIVYSLH
ncbi:MAG: porin family protein [Bacteroidota bacterium]